MTRAAAVLLVLLALPAIAQAHTANVARGRALAIEACSACHKVTAKQRQPGAVADPDTHESVLAPPFTAIAKRYAGDPASLRAFITLPDHPMREQTFLAADLGDIVAYIQSLARQTRRR